MRLLTQRARSAEPIDAKVADDRTIDVALSAHLATDDGAADEVGDRTQTQQTVQYARLTDRLGHLTCRVARDEVGQNANATIVKATEETVLELTHG